MPKNDRYVLKHPVGWAVNRPHADRPSNVYSTQTEAEKRAKEIVKNLGGGEVRIQSRQSQWRNSDTVPYRNNPFPQGIKDNNHLQNKSLYEKIVTIMAVHYQGQLLT